MSEPTRRGCDTDRVAPVSRVRSLSILQAESPRSQPAHTMNTPARIGHPRSGQVTTWVLFILILGGLALWFLLRADRGQPQGGDGARALPSAGSRSPGTALARLESPADPADGRVAAPDGSEGIADAAGSEPGGEGTESPADEKEAEAAQFAAKYAGLTRGQLQLRMDAVLAQSKREIRQAADALLAAGRFEIREGELDPDTGGYWFRGSGRENLHILYGVEGDSSRMKRVEMSPTEFPELYRFKSELDWLAYAIFKSH